MRLVAGGAAAATALAGFTVGLAAPAHAAVTISGSTIDTAGNYVDGRIPVYKFSDLDGDGSVEPFEWHPTHRGDAGWCLRPTWRTAPTSSASARTSTAPAPATEYYRDKADLATADVITVTGPTALPARVLDTVPTVTVTSSQRRSPGPRQRPGLAPTPTPASPPTRPSARRLQDRRLGAGSSCSSPATTRDQELASEYYTDKTDARDRGRRSPSAPRVGDITLSPGGVHHRPRHQRRPAPPAPGARPPPPQKRVLRPERRQRCLPASRMSPTGPYEVRFVDPIDEYAPRVLQQRRRRRRQPRLTRRRQRWPASRRRHRRGAGQDQARPEPPGRHQRHRA